MKIGSLFKTLILVVFMKIAGLLGIYYYFFKGHKQPVDIKSIFKKIDTEIKKIKKAL